MRKIVASLALGCIVALTAPAVARAEEDAEHVTNEPAATLLLPYFEAQVPAKIGGKGKGINTFFSVNNASASAAVAHATVWSDLGLPVITFDMYLTGFDVVRISMQDILNGVFPLTADAGSDPGDKTSFHGPISQDINFPGSTGPCSLDSVYAAPLPNESIVHIRSALTGKFSPLLNGCFGLDYGDKKPIARGFVTIDTVTQCNEMFPSDPGYGSGGIMDTRNILWGDYEILDKSGKIARSDKLVHIRSEGIGYNPSPDPQVTGAGEYTFYSRFLLTAGQSFRQPLASKFAAPYVNRVKDKWFPQGTSLYVWRDPKVATVTPFTCGTPPAWFPLGQEEILVFDQQENVEVIGGTPFGAATQKVKVDGPALPTSFEEGWIYLNLNTTVAASGGIPFEDAAAAQAWVNISKDSKGKFSVYTRANAIESATETLHQQLNN